MQGDSRQWITYATSAYIRLSLCCLFAGESRTMVFVETKRNADFLAMYLSQEQLPTTSIHGDRLQSEREQALADFKSGRCKVLVATAVASRGLGNLILCFTKILYFPKTGRGDPEAVRGNCIRMGSYQSAKYWRSRRLTIHYQACNMALTASGVSSPLGRARQA